MHHPANRIPRITPTRPSLYRRLHRAWALSRVGAQINRLETGAAQLQHWMAMDQACRLAHQLQWTKSLVLQQRMLDDATELRRLSAALVQLHLVRRELEGGA